MESAKNVTNKHRVHSSAGQGDPLAWSAGLNTKVYESFLVRGINAASGWSEALYKEGSAALLQGGNIKSSSTCCGI